jgi:hypothetical protein
MVNHAGVWRFTPWITGSTNRNLAITCSFSIVATVGFARSWRIGELERGYHGVFMK